ncbi:MAG: hypothetical protein AAGL34_13875 [Bacteroidota bacterium]
MSTKSAFTKRVINVNDQERMNLIQGFKNEALKVKDFWLKHNAKGNLYKLSDIISFIEDPSILREVFDKENRDEIIAMSFANGIDVNSIRGLDDIPLRGDQQIILNELEKLKKFSMFNNGLSSKDWLVKEEIQVTEKVEEVFEELSTEFTKAPIASSRLDVLEAFEKHIEQYPNDKLEMIQVIRHGRKFVNYGL